MLDQLTVAAGFAPLDMAPTTGGAELEQDSVREFLDPLPVGRIWGVGPVARARLIALGFERIGDLARCEPARLETLLGPWGRQIGRLARGVEASEVDPYRDPRSYSEENTFGADVMDPQILRSTAIAHAEAVARRLRSDRFRAPTVVLKLKMARRTAPGARGYPLVSRRTTLPEATDDGETISRLAIELLIRANLTEPVRLLGVGVTNIVAEAPGQLPLFQLEERLARRGRLNRALDEISHRFGSNAVVRGTRETAERAGLSLQIKRGED